MEKKIIGYKLVEYTFGELIPADAIFISCRVTDGKQYYTFKLPVYEPQNIKNESLQNIAFNPSYCTCRRSHFIQDDGRCSYCALQKSPTTIKPE